MKTPRSLSSLRWWVFAWFVLALGVSIASPLVRPGTLEMVCTSLPPGSGLGPSIQLVEHIDGVVTDATALDHYCLLCLTGGALPPVNFSLPVVFSPPVHSRTGSAVEPVLASVWRMPARAPPFFTFSLSQS